MEVLGDAKCGYLSRCLRCGAEGERSRSPEEARYALLSGRLRSPGEEGGS